MVDEALSAVVEERRPRGKIKDGVLNEAVYHTMTALAKPTIWPIESNTGHEIGKQALRKEIPRSADKSMKIGSRT